MPMDQPISTILARMANPVQQLWVARRQRSQELKQLHERQWILYWRWYRSSPTPLVDPADWWRSNEVVPTVFKIIETLLPRYILGMFDSPEWFTVEARNKRNEQYEGLVYNLLRTTIEQMRLFPKLYEALKYALIMGHCWGKVYWKEEVSRRQRLSSQDIYDEQGNVIGAQVVSEIVEELDYDGPAFDWVPVDRLFPDPTGQGNWYIEEIDTTLEELEEEQRRFGIYDEAAFQRLLHEVPPSSQPRPGTGDSLSDARSGTSSGVSVEYAREPQATEGIPLHVVSPMREGIGVKLWQCWGKVPPWAVGPDGSEWRLTVIANGRIVLRDVPAPTPDGRPPYFPIKSIPIPGRLYGESVLRYVGPMADQQSRLANMRLDEVYLGVWQQYVYRKGALMSDSKLLMQPGGAIAVNIGPEQSPESVFQVLPRRPVLPEAYNEDQYRQLQAEHAAAATDIMQGVATTDRQTATEVERRLQQGNARHVLQIMWNDYTVKKELLERVWRWLQMRLTRPKLVRISGEEYAEVDLNDIQEPVDIVVAGGMFAISRNTRIQMDQELVTLATSPAFAPFMKPLPILRRLLMDRGWKNVDQFVKTDEEVYVEQILAQMAAMGQQASPEQLQAIVGQAQERERTGPATPSNGGMPSVPAPREEAGVAGPVVGPTEPPAGGAAV
jgi:hypothetical protein